MKNTSDSISALILCLLGIGIWWLSGSFPSLEEGYPGPSLFPRLIAIGLLLGGAWIGVKSLREAKEIRLEFKEKPSLLKLGGGVILVAAYPILQPLIGFMLTLGLVCLGVALLLGIKPWIAIVSALGTVAFIFVTFEMLLGVSL
ncbi:MAG: tripartite tricarboxylate transporter TctB family protein [Saprospiraceae bacterium]|nr:tripartite tricarboxylate transporter TctB family protein [Saprospiraceae bacterium]